jgi:hypothetical protein
MSVQSEDYKDWVNKPCPECGENLLTAEDYKMVQLIMLSADLINITHPSSGDEEKTTYSVEMDGSGSARFVEKP